jgi:hypothetical protein
MIVCLLACIVSFANAATLVFIDNPANRRVVQRNGHDWAEIAITGRFTGAGTRAEARITPQSGQGTFIDWTLIEDGITDGTFAGSMGITTGWYTLEVRVLDNGTQAGQSSSLFGVGDVFITAGQSNAANASPDKLTPQDPRVNAGNSTNNTWKHAADPQPISTGSGGSPWPAFADAYAARVNVPVGLISVAWGGTTVEQWLPENAMMLYPRLQNALQYVGPYGCKAVLWHQGESDAYGPTGAPAYTERLQTVIAASRQDAGFHVPWGVAIATYGPGLAQSRMDTITGAQHAVINADPYVFQGASTDDMRTGYRAPDGIHFARAGLIEHGQRWDAAVAAYSFPQPPTLSVEISDVGDGLVGYDFYLEIEDGIAGVFDVALAFDGIDGATIHQAKAFGAVTVHWESDANNFHGLGSPPFNMQQDSWVFSGWGSIWAKEPGTETYISGPTEHANRYALPLRSTAAIAEDTYIAHIVADGSVSWTGSLSRGGVASPVSGFAGRPGDYNKDGAVDLADYTVWADHFGKIGDSPADGNGDGRVDLADYTIWADHFGEGTAR